MKYCFEIIRHTTDFVSVYAQSEEEAYNLIMDAIENKEIILSSVSNSSINIKQISDCKDKCCLEL